MKRITSMLLAALLGLFVLATPVSAAGEISITEKESQLERKFGIEITYPLRTDGSPGVTANNLETLDRAFSNMGPDMVRQVSDYYQDRNGMRLKVEYVLSDDSYELRDGVLQASFQYPYSCISVYLPRAAGKAINTGENPIALVHEFGHAFHIMCHELRGGGPLDNDWDDFNRGYGYDPKLQFINPDETVFISGYATSGFAEDFAETFAHAFVRWQSGTGFSHRLEINGRVSGLGHKVDYIEKLLRTFLERPAEALENFARMYGATRTVSFEGSQYSGDHLQYIGYPQPRNILQGILNRLELTPDKASWVRRLGAWRILTGGQQFFLFPGGTYVRSRPAAA